MFPKNNNQASWGKFASWYGELTRDPKSYQQKVILPGVLKILDLKGDEKIIDIGCANGFFTNEFAKKAKYVVGIDIAKNLINAAAKNFKRPNLKFLIGDAQNLPFLKDKFDVATMIMAIENINCADAALKEARKILSPNGKLLIVMNHPAFRIPRQSSWEWDEKKKLQYRRIDAYLSEMKIPIQMHPGSAPSEITWTFHRPLQLYFKALKKNGFAVIDLEEWISYKESQSGPRAKAENRIRKEIPLFIAILAQSIDT